MIRVQVRSFHAPRWLAPLLVLIALALLPFALMLGLAVMALVAGVSVLRLFLPSSGNLPVEHPAKAMPGRRLSDPGSSAIDAEYEVKEDHEKGN